MSSGREDRELQRRHRLCAERLRTTPPAGTCWWPHQFVAGAAVCEAKSPAWAGVDSIDVSLFEGFDYVALGPPPQSPEGGGGTPSGTQAVPSNIPSPRPISTKPLSSSPWAKRAASASRPCLSPPARPGSCGAVTWSSPTAGPTTARRRTTTSNHPHRRAGRPRRAGPARVIYPNLMRLDYDNRRTRAAETRRRCPAESKTPLEHFAAFYEAQNGQPLSDEQAAFCQSLIEDIWKEDQA